VSWAAGWLATLLLFAVLFGSELWATPARGRLDSRQLGGPRRNRGHAQPEPHRGRDRGGDLKLDAQAMRRIDEIASAEVHVGGPTPESV